MKPLLILAFAALTSLSAANPTNNPAEGQSREAADPVNESIEKAKIIVLGCKLFSTDHANAFPKNLLELCPAYLPHIAQFSCPLCPKLLVGYDYFGGSYYAPKQVTLQSKAPTPDGKWIVAYSDGEVKLTNKKVQKQK